MLGNETSDEPVVIGLRGVSASDHECEKAAQRDCFLELGQSKATEVIDERTEAFMSGKLDYIEGLYVDVGNGEVKEIKTYEDLRDIAPQEFYYWVRGAIYSTQILSDAERGNSLPG